eukprot:GFUD01040202.1.p1 GENE.GFUD01040202.1~~GFUD01040202.1.p1  ORF type:complete len:211 (+),score=23.73 GFUD01040202.1:41-634(+)
MESSAADVGINMEHVPLHELSAMQINMLDPFRDDPVRGDTDDVECVADYETNVANSLTCENPLDPKDFCECGLCKPMRTREESFCCKSRNFLQATDACIVQHPLVNDLLKKEVLEINLRTERSVKGEQDTRDFQNKNYRFSAYRSLFFWLNKKKRTQTFRKALPECLVSHVRSLYPDVSYTGFLQALPIIRSKRRKN